MKIALVISEAERQGIKVDYTMVNAGRGTTKIKITKIDGVSFTGSNGNNALRSRMGKSLTPRQTAQRAKANTATRMGAKEKKLLREHNRKMRKLKGPTISQKKYRQRKATTGRKEVQKQMRNSERHKRGFAYSANIDYFINLIKDSVYMLELQPVIDWLKANRRSVNDNSLYECMQIFYNLMKDTSPYDGPNGPYKARDDMLGLLRTGSVKLKTAAAKI